MGNSYLYGVIYGVTRFESIQSRFEVHNESRFASLKTGRTGNPKTEKLKTKTHDKVAGLMRCNIRCIKLR